MYESLLQTYNPTYTCMTHDTAKIIVLQAGRSSLGQGLCWAYAASYNENSVKSL